MKSKFTKWYTSSFHILIFLHTSPAKKGKGKEENYKHKENYKYIYVCVCIYIYIYMYVCVYIYIFTCMCVCVCVCIKEEDNRQIICIKLVPKRALILFCFKSTDFETILQGNLAWAIKHGFIQSLPTKHILNELTPDQVLLCLVMLSFFPIPPHYRQGTMFKLFNNLLQMVTAAMELKDAYSLEGKL